MPLTIANLVNGIVPAPASVQANLPVGTYASMPTGTPLPASSSKGITRPLPLWAFILGIIAIIGGIITAFATGSDWAAGDLTAAIVAASIAVVLTLVLIVRSIAGMAARSNPHRLRQYISAGLIILVLFASSGTGLLIQNSMHSVQAHYMEGQKQWEGAIKQYELGGEKAPSSSDLARTYNEWGEDLSQKGIYGIAISRFDIVINEYASQQTQVDHAQQSESHAYIEWGKHDLKQHDYMAAASHLDMALNQTYCSAECRGEATPLTSTAYYNKAKFLLGLKEYQESVKAFEVVQSRFPQSPEAQQQHPDMSTALLGEGKQAKDIVCSDAVPIYQELAEKFADTPEGREAKMALSAPQPVVGHFIPDIPKASDGYLDVQAALIPDQSSDISDTEFYAQLDNAPTALVDSNGDFTFKPLKQGTYDLVWGFSRPDGSRTYTSTSIKNTNQYLYVAQIGPLCSFNFGEINEKFLTS
ncbi:hypothetical protein KDA_21890 [Dictyobacter alpinus]|uniref:Tetratricopeptide repeat protein n=2 Tax=Dictyobacter alpinus TaxID=2014873 RepID=A0A402B5U2_9CHLR|nr:hypothetical protein KDA_21890 [Dictyobacter alpinus]